VKIEYLLLIFMVMALTAVGGIAQHRYYARTVARLAREHDEPGSVLISGRGKGRLRGAIVVLVIRKTDEVIRAAAVMEGATVLARFKERQDWVGLPVRGDLPECSPRVAKAVAEALAHMPGRRRPLPASRAALRGAPKSPRTTP
jgi:glucitol operon activator protein